MSTNAGSREVILAFGLPGTGKSALLHDLSKFEATRYPVFACDHEDGWANPESPHWRGAPPKRLVVVDDLEGDEVWSGEPGLYVFKTSRFDSRDVAQLCLDVSFDVVLVDDEIDKAGRRSEFDAGPLRTILNEGRHIEHEDEDTGESIIHRVHLFGACRRPQKIHNDFELATQVYCFRLQGNRTLQRLRDDAYIEDEQWERIRTLPNFHFLHWPSGTWKSIQPLGRGGRGNVSTGAARGHRQGDAGERDGNGPEDSSRHRDSDMGNE
jgi:hypothetical protein